VQTRAVAHATNLQ